MIRKDGAVKTSTGETICSGCSSFQIDLSTIKDDIYWAASEFWIKWNYNTTWSDEWWDNEDYNENNNVYVSQIDESLILPPWAGEDVFQDALSKDGSLVTGSFVNGTFIPEYERCTPVERTHGCREFLSESRLNLYSF